MFKTTIQSITALMIGTLLVTAGSGLLGTVLAVRLSDTPNIGNMSSGVVMACVNLGLLIGALHCYQIIERIGHIRAFAAFATLISAATLAHGFGIGFWYWATLRIIAGYCTAGLLMCIESWLNAKSSNEIRGMILSVYMVVYYIGMGIGQVMLNIPDSSGYMLYIISSIVLSLSLLPIVMTRVAAPSLPEPERFSLKRLYEISPLGVIGAIINGMITSSFYTMTPMFTRQSGMDIANTSLLMTAAIVGGFLMQWPVGWLSDRNDRRKVLFWTGVLSVIFSVIMASAASDSITLMVICITFLGAAIFAAYPVVVAHANDFIPADELIPASAGLVLCVGIGSIAGPILASVFMNIFGPFGLFIYIAVFGCALTAACVWRIVKGPEKPPELAPFQNIPQRATHVYTEMDPRSDESYLEENAVSFYDEVSEESSGADESGEKQENQDRQH